MMVNTDKNTKNPFEKVKKVYLIGIKGSGMVALAEVFQKMGKKVTGSDVEDKFFTDEVLKKLGIFYYEGFSEENIKKEKGIDLVVYSTAYKKEVNQELALAYQKNFWVISYPEAIGLLMKDKFGLAVCGTHGKTTTTAMLALAMRDLGIDPTAIIGSKVKQLGSNALVGKSNFFIVEADEYQEKFLNYNPWAIILTNLDFDHPDYFVDFVEYKKAFKKFIQKLPRYGFLVAWGGSRDILEVVKKANCEVILYDFFKNQYQINEEKEKLKKEGIANLKLFNIPQNLRLKIPGKHNLLNAGAVLATCQKIGLDLKKVRESLENYQGTARRFELLGKFNGALIIDDYAHHPEEIKATLKAAREKYPTKRIICVFHPHTFSRTEALFSQFSQSFINCDELVLLDIYPSAREKEGKVTSAQLARETARFHPQVIYLGDFERAFQYLVNSLGFNDVLITMGAGDVNKLGERLVRKQNQLTTEEKRNDN